MEITILELQETRRYIIEILRQNGSCTVEKIVEALSERLGRKITTVTIRHHLERLRAEGLVHPPEICRRDTPGRPQYSYALTTQAYEYFPNNYAGFAAELLVQIKSRLPQQEVNVIMQEVANDMAVHAHIPMDVPLHIRLDYVVNHLNSQGYMADWAEADGGYLLSTTNCPYERVAEHHAEVCNFDLRLISSMLGVVPRFVGKLRDGDTACQYFIPK
jgi:predicted ArsR family transcriptional regulator